MLNAYISYIWTKYLGIIVSIQGLTQAWFNKVKKIKINPQCNIDQLCQSRIFYNLLQLEHIICLTVCCWNFPKRSILSCMSPGKYVYSLCLDVLPCVVIRTPKNHLTGTCYLLISLSKWLTFLIKMTLANKPTAK